MALSWRFGAYSDIGRTRKKNDDSAYAGPHLIVVADGMGGAAAGDLASAVAVQTLQRLDAPPPDDLLEALAGTLHRANDRLAELIDEDAAVAGMGTTVTAALFDGEHIGVAHLGDSRGYLWRDGELLRLTADHTWVQSLIDEGRLTEDEAKVHSHRSLLLKVLDGQHDHNPDLKLYDVKAGDRVLLCSDGLSGFVGADRIEHALSIGTADSVARELTQLALEAGSTDNITVVVADVVDAGNVSTDPIAVGAVIEQTRGALERIRSWTHRDESPSGKSLMADPDVDPEELRYAPREPRRFAVLRRLGVLIVLTAVAATAGFIAYQWTQDQYYVAAYGDRVAIYRGVQANLPVIDLHSVYQAQDVRLSELPSFRRSQVLEGMPADSLDNARRIVGNLRSFAKTCAQQVRASAAATASAGATPQPTGTATPTGSSSTPTSAPHRTTTSTPLQGTTQPRTTQPNTPKQSAASGGSRSPNRTSLTGTPAAGSTGGASAPEECAGATPVTTPPAIVANTPSTVGSTPAKTAATAPGTSR